MALSALQGGWTKHWTKPMGVAVIVPKGKRCPAAQMKDKQPDTAPRSSGSAQQGRLALTSPLASCLVFPKPIVCTFRPRTHPSGSRAIRPDYRQSRLPCSFPPPDRVRPCTRSHPT